MKTKAKQILDIYMLGRRVRANLKIVDAFWEKRNLGVCCHEIEIELGDEADFLKKELPLNEAAYTVVKVPSNKFDVMFLLQELGYTYIESSINLVHDLKEIRLNPLQQRIMDSVSYSTMTDKDIDHVFREIRKGIFTTDRIYIDPYFSHEQAANRYVNWIGDELERGCKIFKLTYKNDSVGFFTFKDIGNGVCYPFLAGMYEKYLNSGLGICTIEKPLKHAIKMNYKKYSTFISSNNTSTFSAHVALNFSFRKIYHVYIKHIV